MPTLSVPFRQEFLYSLKSFTLMQGLELFAGLISATVDVSIDGADPKYGTGMIPYGEPRGELKVEGELVFIAKAWFDFARAHPFWLTERFDFSGHFVEGSNVDSIALESVRLIGGSLPIEGTEATEVTLKYRAYNVRVNGLAAIDSDALGALGDAGAS